MRKVCSGNLKKIRKLLGECIRSIGIRKNLSLILIAIMMAITPISCLANEDVAVVALSGEEESESAEEKDTATGNETSSEIPKISEDVPLEVIETPEMSYEMAGDTRESDDSDGLIAAEEGTSIDGNAEGSFEMMHSTDDSLISVGEVLPDEISEASSEGAMGSTYASTSGTCGDNLTWTIDSKGTLTISGTGKMKNYSDYEATPWYSDRSSISSIVIESGVTSIGQFAFYYCSNLTSVTISNSVTSIGDYAFSTCKKLTSITIPKGVTSIGDCAFSYCSNLKSITIPDTLKSIGEWAFESCSSLTSAVLPEGLTEIAEGTFCYCKSLKSITIPSKVTNIGSWAFSCCNFTSITIPERVTSIGKGAFWNCGSLAVVTIPEAVKTISDSAFDDCIVLKNVYYGGSKSKWAKISIGSNNSPLTSASIRYTISSCTMGLSSGTITYDGSAKQPTVTVMDGNNKLTQGTDYTVSYSNNTNVGTATATVTGKGNYTGTASATFKINAASISSGTMTLSSTSYTYNGSAKKPTVTVKNGSKTLKSGTDYTVSYSNNTNAGTATAKVTGKGNYTGTVKKNFTINKANQTLTAKASSSSIVKGKTAMITVSGKGTISYSSNKKSVASVSSKGKITAKAIGTAKITVKAAGNSNYKSASKTLKIKVIPKETTLKSAKSSSSKKLTVKWKKVSGVSGYQIQYSTNKNFKSGNKKVKVSGASKVSKTISKLKKGKTYYVRVRTYKKVSGTKYYSSWSSKKKVKVK